MITSRSFSAIIPLYNEIDCLPATLEEIYSYLESTFADFEIVIVESGSTDGSAAACDAFATGRTEISVIHETERNGAGSALQLGFENAVKDLVCTTWIDLPFPIESIARAVPYLDDHDVVLSYRSPDDRALFRRAQSVIYNSLAKFLLGIRVKHVNSAFRVFRRSVVQSVVFRSRGWLVEGEIIYRLQQMNVVFTEIPVQLIDRQVGTSSVTFSTPFYLLRDLLSFWWSERIRRHPGLS